MRYSVYKERTLDPKNDLVPCNECFDKLKVKKEVKCNGMKCKEKFSYTPYYYEKLGFELPTKCKMCREIVEETCEYEYCSK